MGRSLVGLPKYWGDYNAYKKAAKNAEHAFPLKKLVPILSEYAEQSGVATGQYFHQDIIVARRIYKNNPKRHLDLASRVDGFVAHLAVFRHVDVADIRPLETQEGNIDFLQSDFMADDIVEKLGTSDSVSCLHAIEHFGLGRYGDPIDPDGHVKGLKNISRVVKKGGILYLSVPIGTQRVEFNGHRIFDVHTVVNILGEDFEVKGFSYIDDKQNVHEDIDLFAPESKNNFGCRFGLGIYEMKRIA